MSSVIFSVYFPRKIGICVLKYASGHHRICHKIFIKEIKIFPREYRIRTELKDLNRKILTIYSTDIFIETEI